VFEFVYANTEFIVSSWRKKLFFSLLHMLHVSARFLTLLNVTKLYTKPTTLSVVFLYLIIIYNYFMMFSITKVVQGSFNQSHPKFGETAGIQCACNSLFSICWSKIRQVNRWNKYDLDHVLNNGDGIYKFLLYGPGPLDKIRFLDVDDLPREIILQHRQIGLTFLELKDGELSFDINNTSLVTLFYSTNVTGDGFLLIFSDVVLAITYNNDTQNSYFLFDSHSRSQQGLPVPDGTSVLMKFSRLCEIENYLKQVYLHADRRRCFYQLQFIEVVLTDTSASSLIQNFRNEMRRHSYSNTIGTPEHAQSN